MKNKTLSILTIASLGFLCVPSVSYAWSLSTHPDGYRITCADGFVGHFDRYPTEKACNKVCSTHGGVVNIEPFTSPRLTYMQNHEIKAEFLPSATSEDDDTISVDKDKVETKKVYQRINKSRTRFRRGTD